MVIVMLIPKVKKRLLKVPLQISISSVSFYIKCIICHVYVSIFACDLISYILNVIV